MVRRWFGAALGGLVACAPVGPSRAPAQPRVLAPWPSSLREVPRYECDTEACWEGRAVAAAGRGELDGAAGLRGRAFEHAPSPARLGAWVQAWLECGAVGRARGVLELARRDFARGDAAWAANITRRLAALPATAQQAVIWPARPTGELRAAYLALAEGRVRAAEDAFARAGADAPYHLSHRAGVQWALGREVEARRNWSRARAGFDGLGATLHVEPVGMFAMADVLWSGEQVVSVERVHAPRRIARSMQALRFHGAKGTQRLLRFGSEAQQTVIRDDGTVLRSEYDALVEYDLTSGIALRKVVTDDGRIDDFVVVGEGDAQRVLTRHEQVVTLWDASGRVRTRHTIDRPENPFSPPALALGPDGRLVAVAGDARLVRVFDSLDGSEQVWPLPRAASDVEWSHVTALAFTAAGDELVAVARTGDVMRWAVPGGRLKGQSAGRCSGAELAAARKLWAAENGPLDRSRCGALADAVISADGVTVVTHSYQGWLRIQRGDTRETIGVLKGGSENIGPLALSRAGALAVGVRGGGPRRWRPGRRGLVAVDDGPETYVELSVRVEGNQVLVERTVYSDDAEVENAEPEVLRWDVETGVRVVEARAVGSQVHDLDDGAVQVEYAASGQAAAWSEGPRSDVEGGYGEVRWRRLDSPDAPESSLELSERPVAIAISRDGDEVLVTTWDALIRWSPASGQWTHISGMELQQEHVAITGGGATLTLGGAKRTRIFSNDAHMRLLATVAPLPSGGWVAVSEAGAVDGSPDAPDHVVTRVMRGDALVVFDGRLGWDAARVPGLVARSLAGEDVPPPGLVRGVAWQAKHRRVLRSEAGERSSVIIGVSRGASGATQRARQR